MGSTQAGVFTLARASYSPYAASSGNNINHSSSLWNTRSQMHINTNNIPREEFYATSNQMQFTEKDRISTSPSPQIYEQAQDHDLGSKITKNAALPTAISSMSDTSLRRKTYVPKKKQKPPAEPLENKKTHSEKMSSIEHTELREEKSNIPHYLLSQKYFGSHPR